MEKKKIAILTTYYANFGSYFQATALQKEVENLGYECELINEYSRIIKSYKMLITVLLTPFLPKKIKEFLASKIPQYYAYLRLKKNVKGLKTSSAFSINLKQLSKRYDCIIVGSDELWSANKKTIVYYPYYFGINLLCPHIAYGPSATMFEYASPKRRKQMVSGLKSFSKISVRDIFTSELIEEMTGNRPDLVVDPTLLNPYFANKGTGGGKYVLVYGQHYSEEEVQTIIEFAHKNNWKVQAVAWQHEWCDGFIDTQSAEDMQIAFNKSEYCFPSTFHGVIFSVLNQRDFISFINPLRGRKVKMLLATIGLEERIYSGTCPEDMASIDYELINDQLSILRKESREFLISALKEACNE